MSSLNLSPDKLVISCEHASNRLPAKYRAQVDIPDFVLNSHRAYDRGAVAIARILARKTGAALHVGKYSRLLIDLNRSLHHPGSFSYFSKSLSHENKQAIVESIYRPYRDKVENQIESLIKHKSIVLHLAIHSFTPVLDGDVRNCDLGLLYDPSRRLEKKLAGTMRIELKKILPTLRVRSNYPYRGTADGFTTYLRSRFSPGKYAGFEIEVNQAALPKSRLIASVLYKMVEELLE